MGFVAATLQPDLSLLQNLTSFVIHVAMRGDTQTTTHGAMTHPSNSTAHANSFSTPRSASPGWASLGLNIIKGVPQDFDRQLVLPDLPKVLHVYNVSHGGY